MYPTVDATIQQVLHAWSVYTLHMYKHKGPQHVHGYMLVHLLQPTGSMGPRVGGCLNTNNCPPTTLCCKLGFCCLLVLVVYCCATVGLAGAI